MTKINRREFIKAGISVGAAGAMFSMGLPGSAWAAEGVPRKGGILKLGLAGGSSSDSYDPGSWSDTFTFIGFSAVYNSLVEIDVDGSAIPELAEGWTASEDARIWTFKLRSGIEFHNGKTMDADDVVASINHHRRDDSTSAAKTVLSEVKDVRATDQNTVVVELVAGNADFPYVMADYHIVIMPSKDGVADWKAGVGTGGYQLKEFNPGLRMVLARNPNYWKPGRAHFDGAELIGISDGAARVNALMTGEVDVINRVDLKTISLLKRNRQIVIEETKGAQHYTFPMLCDSDVFKNNDVRMALKHAVDREAMVKTILLGYGYAGNDHPITASNRFFNAELEQRQYDPDKARFYMRKAGLDKLRVQLHASDAAYAGAVDTSVMFKEQAKKAGIEIDVSREPSDGFWSSVWHKKPFCTSFWYSSLTADRMFSLGYARDASWNESHWKHERFNQLLTSARGELNDTLRREMYNEMQQLCRDEGGSIIPMFASSVAARTTRVAHGGATAPFGELDGLRIIERWWLA